MAIVKMKHLRLIAMMDDREELLKLLQSRGCVEIVAPELASESDAPEVLAPARSGELFAAQEEHSGAERALSVLKRYAPDKKGLLTPRPQVEQAELFDEGLAETARTAAAEINDLERQLAAIQSDEGKIAQQIAAQFSGKRVDMMVGIATPMAQACYNAAAGDMPTIFTAVTDPVAAGFADTNGVALGDVTGTSDALPIKAQLETIRQRGQLHFRHRRIQGARARVRL